MADISFVDDLGSEIINYNQAIMRTIPKEPKSCCQKFTGRLGRYQLFMILAYLTLKNAYHPFLFGLGFLTKPAKNFECLHESEDGSSEWTPCTKKEICDQQLDKDHWRPVKDDEYIDNWVSPDKFDLLCQPKEKIGLIGSMFFIGQVTTILIIPPLADFWLGRKPVFVATGILSVIVIAGFLFSDNIYELYVF